MCWDKIIEIRQAVRWNIMKKNITRQIISTIEKFKNNNNKTDMASFIELIINFSHHKMGEILMTGLFLSKSRSLKDSRIYNRTNKIRICWIALYYIRKINKLAKTDLLRIYQTLMRMNKNLKELNLKLSSILLISNRKSKVKGNK